MRNKFYFLIAVMIVASQAVSQIMVNKTWEQLAGAPDPDVDWSESRVDIAGKLVTVGNTFNESDENYNFYISKVNPETGEPYWEVEWNGPDDMDDYATGLHMTSDAIYVCGLAKYSSNASDWIVLKLDPQDGSTIWTYTHDDQLALSAAPADIIVDTLDVFVTGAVLKSSTSSDYLTMRLDKEYGTLVWSEDYDYDNFYDVGVRMAMSNDYVYVTGASGSDWDDAQITTLRYNKSDGSNGSATTFYNPSEYIDLPTDLEVDLDGNVYVCGKFDTGSSIDIVTIKLDEVLDTVWTAS